jgi:prepilin-type N-terminal cleavage/methylation domain-containing protein
MFMIGSRLDESGLTLIETLISLMVFSVGMLGLSGLTTVIIHGNTLSQRMTIATVLAQDKAEAMHNMPYKQLASQVESILTDNQSRYTRRTEVTDNTPGQGMKTVSIAVYWTQSKSAKRHVSLQTIVIDDR